MLPTTNGPGGTAADPVARPPGRLVGDRRLRGPRSRKRRRVRPTGRPAFPSIVGRLRRRRDPSVGWGALGALSADPGDPGRLWAASDAAYATGRVYRVDVDADPAVIEEVVEVTDGDTAPALRHRGALGPRRRRVLARRRRGDRRRQRDAPRGPRRPRGPERVALPAEVTDRRPQVGPGRHDHHRDRLVRGRVRRPPAPAVGRPDRRGRRCPAPRGQQRPHRALRRRRRHLDLVRLPACDDDRGRRLDGPVRGDRGRQHTLAVIERDKLNGPAAPSSGSTPSTSRARAARPRRPRSARSSPSTSLPAMQALKGWTQEKLEGLTIGADGEVYAVTDNDGLRTRPVRRSCCASARPRRSSVPHRRRRPPPRRRARRAPRRPPRLPRRPRPARDRSPRSGRRPP